MPGNKKAYAGAIKKASTAAWDRQWVVAIREYQRALAEFPQDPTAHAGLSAALEGDGRFEEALNEYRVTRNLVPGDPNPIEKTAALQEKLGHLDKAADDYLILGEILVGLKQNNKAIAAWKRAASLAPKRIDVHEKLFTAYKESGNERASAQELTALAMGHHSLGDDTRAQIMLQQALSIDPQNSQARALKAELQSAPSSRQSGARDNPVEKARRSSLSRLAQTVFEDGPRWRRSSPTTLRGQQIDVDRLLAGAIDAQTHGNIADAIDKYEQIQRAGRAATEVQFNLALLYKESLRYDDAIDLLHQTSEDPQFASASYFAIGECSRAQGRVELALENFIQAMKMYDLTTVGRDHVDQVIRLYESLAESYRERGAQANAEKCLSTLVDFLSGKGWEDKVREVRRHLETVEQSGTPISFAEVLELPDSERVIESLGFTEEYMKQGHLVAATDEALRAIELAPDYLPAHQRLAEILAANGRTQEARDKFEKLAETALARGDISKAESYYHQALSLAPEDVTRRTKLIDLLISHGQLADALTEYLELGDVLEKAGQTQAAIDRYVEGIRLAQRGGAVSPAVPLLRVRLADSYMKRHDWKNASTAYREVRADSPDDERAQFYLIELSLRLGERQNAERELDDLLVRNVRAPNKVRAILVALLRIFPDDVSLNIRLARALSASGQKEKAVEGLDGLGERLLNNGKQEEAIAVIRAIVALGPSRVEDYKKVLDSLSANS